MPRFEVGQVNDATLHPKPEELCAACQRTGVARENPLRSVGEDVVRGSGSARLGVARTHRSFTMTFGTPSSHKLCRRCGVNPQAGRVVTDGE